MAPEPSAFACSESRARAWLAGSFIALLVVASSAVGCAHGSQQGPPTSMLEISSEVGDADVWVDGQYIGQVTEVSGRLALTPGVHRVEIRKPGHFPVQRTIRVDKRGGGSVHMSAELLEDPR